MTRVPKSSYNLNVAIPCTGKNNNGLEKNVKVELTLHKNGQYYNRRITSACTFSLFSFITEGLITPDCLGNL